MKKDIEELEGGMSSFDTTERRKSFEDALAEAKTGGISMMETGEAVNLHCHSFYSYNPADHSPTLLAWLARKAGLYAVGIVDFDVVDGVDEFLDAAATVGIRGTAGIESRVFLPEFGRVEINSPGEPGIAYHMGAGMPASTVPAPQQGFLNSLKWTAQQRNRELIDRVNHFTAPVILDYEKDLVPLTPNGNATERHICQAYQNKAAEMFKNTSELKNYWESKLGELPEEHLKPGNFDLQALIRKKTMKQGGIGYMAPEGESFPSMLEFNQFITACGGIPTLAWLDGTSAGEERMEELFDLEIAMGVSAVNLIPDRNYSPGVIDVKLEKLRQFIDLAESRHLPILIGTEMNAPGLKFVDDFDSAELKPLLPAFVRGANILYAHTFMQRKAGIGYTSPWGKINFPERESRNRFYEELGRLIKPELVESLNISSGMEPSEMMNYTKDLN